MTKQLPTDGIANELAGSSVFFPSSAQAEAVAPKLEIKPTSQTETQETVAAKPPTMSPATPPPKEAAATANGHAAVVSRHHDTTVTGDREIAAPTSQAPADATLLEEVRKAAKQFGKEAATHRFTAAEKRAIADIVYTYNCQGVKTSENEITRIAVNWLLLDYHRYGAQSVLAQLLDSLHG